MEYELSETRIKDKSVLGTPGKKMCENIDVYWLTPVTRHDSRDNNDDNEDADADDDDDDAGKPTVADNSRGVQ